LAAVDDHGVSDNEGGRIRTEPDNGGGDFLGLAHPSNGFLRNHPLLSLVGASGKAIHHRRGDNAGAHGVDADVLRGVVFQRQLNGSRETKSFDVALSWSVAVSVLFSTLMRIFTVFVFSLGVTRARAESSAPRTAAQPRAITPAIAAVRIKAGNRFRFILASCDRRKPFLKSSIGSGEAAHGRSSVLIARRSSMAR
jgi:hypothetical protein